MKILTKMAVLTGLLLVVAGCGEAAGTAAQPDDGAEEVAEGMAALEAQNVRGAIKAFAAAARVCGTNFEARVQLALAHLRQGEVAEADRAVREACALCPESAEARLVDGQVAYLKKDYARARAAFSSVAAEAALPAAVRSEAFVGRGIVELAQDACDAARISFLRALRLNPRSAAAWYHLGVLSRDTYRFNEAALEQFEMAARLSDPRDARTKKISHELIPALRKALQAAAAGKPGAAKRDPAAAAKLFAEGEQLQKKKMIRAAIKKFAAAFAADPFSEAAAARYAHLLALNDKSASGVDKALAAYRAAIDQRPGRQDYYLAAARLAYANKRWSTAVQIMDRAVAHDPEKRATLDLLIASLLKAGKAKQAEAWKAYRAELK